MLGLKIQQLGKRTRDLIVGEAQVPGVDFEHVRRIWPVVVTGSALLESEVLWDYIDAHAVDLHSLSRVQPLTLLDLCDLEQLAGLIENGHGLVKLLERKALGPYARIDFRRFVSDDPFLPDGLRGSAAMHRWHRAMDVCVGALGLDATTLAEEAA